MGGVTAFPHPAHSPQGEIMKSTQSEPDWIGIAAGSTFLAGALLLLNGKKKAAMAVTAGAMALTLLDQQETIKEWWNMLPRYLDHAERLLDNAAHTIEDLAAKRDKLRGMFNR
jgi:hypothetical protein